MTQHTGAHVIGWFLQKGLSANFKSSFAIFSPWEQDVWKIETKKAKNEVAPVDWKVRVRYTVFESRNYVSFASHHGRQSVLSNSRFRLATVSLETKPFRRKNWRKKIWNPRFSNLLRSETFFMQNNPWTIKRRTFLRLFLSHAVFVVICGYGNTIAY